MTSPLTAVKPPRSSQAECGPRSQGPGDQCSQSDSTPRTWPSKSDVLRVAPLDFSCPRLQAVERLLDSPRGLGWINNTLEGLRLPDSLRPLVRGRIRLLLMRGARVAFDISVSSFDERVLQALDALTPEVWICIFKDTTSPITLLIGLDRSVLDRGIGQIGPISIPPFIWNFLAPEDFESVASRDLGSMRSMSEDGLVMARALVRDGAQRVGGGGGEWLHVPGPEKLHKGVNDCAPGEV